MVPIDFPTIQNQTNQVETIARCVAYFYGLGFWESQELDAGCVERNRRRNLEKAQKLASDSVFFKTFLAQASHLNTLLASLNTKQPVSDQPA